MFRCAAKDVIPFLWTEPLCLAHGMPNLLLSKWGVDRLAVVTSDLTLNRATTIFSTLLPTFTTRFHAAPCPSLHVEHVDLIAEQEGKLMAVLREDLSAYLEYLEAGGVWPPRDAAHTKT